MSAQLDTGIFSGRITDASGAVIPNAPITIVETQTNFTTEAKTNADGLYRVPALRPGNYRITVKTSGFKTAVRDGLELRVGDNQEVNIALEVGGTSDSVVVTAEAAQLQTETSSSGAVLEGSYLQKLPLYQRYVESAFFLLPNIDIQGFGYAGNLQGFHIDGLQDSKIGYFQDGTYAVSNNNGTIYTAQTIQSTVEEVKVLGTVLPAEYGHSGGGALMSVQRTGTNTLHGEISEFGRVSAMQHRKYFDLYHFGQQQPGQVATPSELFMQPNATLHGPVYIPHIYNGKNRTFFVFAVERVIEKQAKQQAYTVPDAQELMGNFSFAGHGVTPNQLYDPLSTTLVNGQYMRTPIAGNIIPASRIDPVAQKFLALNPYALPNAPGSYSNTGPSNNFQGTYLKKYFSENYTGRIDQQFSPSFKIFGNWLYKSIYQRSPNPQLSNPIFDGSLVAEHDYNHTATLGATKILSPTLINEFRLGYNRFVANVTGPDVNAGIAAMLGIPNVSGAYLPNGLPLTVGTPSLNVLENFTVKDDMTWVKNKHSFKFGYDLLHERQDNHNLGNPSGTFTFDTGAGLTGNGSTTIANTGMPNPSSTTSSLAAFELGSVSSASFSIPTASWLPRDNINSFFFQDDWKFSRTLTLNLGVRWVMESPFHTKYGQFSQFNPTGADNVAAGDTGVIAHPGGNITKREWQAPEPRIGVAWHPIEKLVVRSGFALLHSDLGLAPSQLDEYSIASNQNQVSGNPTPLYQISHGPNPIVYPGLTSQGTQSYTGCTNGSLNGTTLLTCSGRSTTITNPNLKDPYSMTWNLTLQYQLFHNTLVELSYDGTAGVGLIDTPNLNVLPESYGAGNNTLLAALVGNSQVYRPYVNFGTINYRENVSHSTYHAGTVHVQKRLSAGLLWDSFFTYAKSLDGTGVGNVDVATNLYKGPSSYDRRFRYVGNFSYDIPLGKGRRWMNRGGVADALFGGYNLVWQYDAYSGNPITWGTTNSPYTYLPSYIGITGRPNLIGTPALRSDWQDLGGDRFNQGNQNSTICCLSDFAYPAQYTFGNAGKNTFYTQRGIGASFSAHKEFKLKERLTLQLRLDFQNPFKWYNWGNMNTTVDLKNVAAGSTTETTGNLFGKVSSGNEATTVADGGVPMMNATIRLRW
ncbi:MAG TPA: carboxypeptidase-like regulatory domain-containing protein [Bryobacteraceae bacterium]|nr:carboxypeptidase-like regulatory domain-containing protein [Bryobacteraceae bacterium]